MEESFNCGSSEALSCLLKERLSVRGVLLDGLVCLACPETDMCVRAYVEIGRMSLEHRMFCGLVQLKHTLKKVSIKGKNGAP